MDGFLFCLFLWQLVQQANRRMEDEQVDDQSVSGTGTGCGTDGGGKLRVVRLGIRMQLQRDTKHRHEPQYQQHHTAVPYLCGNASYSYTYPEGWGRKGDQCRSDKI